MKNTEGNYKIVKRNRLKKVAISGGIFVTGLFLNLTDVHCRELIQSNEEAIELLLSSYTKEGFPTYQDVYKNIFSLIDTTQFDSKFIDAYNNVDTLIIDDVVYSIDKVVALHVVGDGAKIIYNGDIFFDIVSNNTFKDYCDNTLFFKDTSFFYQMYLDGKIEDKCVKITHDEAINYVNDWQGNSHTESSETIADNKTKDFFLERFRNQGR